MVRIRGLLFIYKIQGEGEKLSLKIWLPLIESKINQGLIGNLSFSIDWLTQNANGKLGKCYGGAAVYNTNQNIIGNSWTISMWVKSSSWGVYNDILACKNVSSSDHCQFYFSIINGATFNIGVNAGSSSLQYSYTFATNTWYHLAATYDGKKCVMYINGNNVKQGNITNSLYTDCTNIGIGCRSTNTSGTSITGQSSTRYFNDVRFYDEALSPKEIKNISRGLVCHYTLSRPSENLLSRYVSPGSQNPNVTSTAGRTNYYGDYGIIIPATENADTYFRLYLKEQLVTNETYTISCNASGLLNGTYYRFPLFSQGNTSMGVLNIDHNGICSLTFQMTYSTQSAVSVGNETVYVCFMDDSARALASGQGSITLTNFKIEKGTNVTPWFPANTDPIYSFVGLDSNIEEDVSGYGNDGTRIGTFSWSSDTPRYNTSTYASGSASTYLEGSKLPSEAKTVSLWIKCSKTVNSAIFNDKTSGLQIGLLNSLLYINSLASTAGFTTTHWINDEWNHVVAINNNGTRSVYVNGQPETQSGASNYYLHNSDNFWLWKRSYNNSYTFTGSLSDLRIYVTALSADDVLELYHAPISLSNNGTLMTQGEYVEV